MLPSDYGEVDVNRGGPPGAGGAASWFVLKPIGFDGFDSFDVGAGASVRLHIHKLRLLDGGQPSMSRYPRHGCADDALRPVQSGCAMSNLELK